MNDIYESDLYDAEMCRREKLYLKLFENDSIEEGLDARLAVLNYIFRTDEIYPKAWNYFKSTAKKNIVLLELLHTKGLEWCCKQLELTDADKTGIMAEVLGAK